MMMRDGRRVKSAPTSPPIGLRVSRRSSSPVLTMAQMNWELFKDDNTPVGITVDKNKCNP